MFFFRPRPPAAGTSLRAWILQRLDTSREDHPPLHRSMIIVAHVMLYLVLLCIALSPHSVEADFSPWRDQEHERDMRKRKEASWWRTSLQLSPYASLCDSA